MFAGNFAPRGWLFCDGSLLSIADNDVLFNLLGTTYGGDGMQTFALPDLRGRVPVHQGASPQGSQYVPGQLGGSETVTLTVAQLPNHSHALLGSAQAATTTAPGGQVLASVGGGQVYLNDTPTTALGASSVGAAGGSQPHDNRMPFLGINYIISLFGIYPSQT